MSLLTTFGVSDILVYNSLIHKVSSLLSTLISLWNFVQQCVTKDELSNAIYAYIYYDAKWVCVNLFLNFGYYLLLFISKMRWVQLTNV